MYTVFEAKLYTQMFES